VTSQTDLALARPTRRRSAGPPRGGLGWRWPALIFVTVVGVYLASPSAMTADSIFGVRVAYAMVHYHSIGLDHFNPLQGPAADLQPVGPHIYPLFPWTVSLFAAPVVAALDVLHRIGIGRGAAWYLVGGRDWVVQVISMSVVVGFTAIVLYQIARRILVAIPEPRRTRWAAGVALVFAFGTSAWSTASRSMWQHGPSMLFLSLAILFALRADRGESGWMGLGAALAASYTVRPTNAIPLVVVGAWVLLTRRDRIGRVIAGAVPVAFVFLLVNRVAYHAWLPKYFRASANFAVTGRTAEALLGNLVSPGRGLLVFCPLVVLSGMGVIRQARQGWRSSLWIAFAVVPVLHWVLISAFKQWWGGDSYGPRFFTDMTPFFVVLALPAVERLALVGGTTRRLGLSLTAVLIAWSSFVQVQGATLRSAWCWNAEPVNVDLKPSHVWAWSDPQFLRGARRLAFGPDRRSEIRRAGVIVLGCPSEPVRP
jgi:hypothetical protein